MTKGIVITTAICLGVMMQDTRSNHGAGIRRVSPLTVQKDRNANNPR